MGPRNRNFFLLFPFTVLVGLITIWGNGNNIWVGKFLEEDSHSTDFMDNYFEGVEENGDSQEVIENRRKHAFVYQVMDEKFIGTEKNKSDDQKTVILMWTKYYKASDALLSKLILQARNWDPDCCSDDDVIVTLDRNMLETATVIVFFNYYRNINATDMPPTRTPEQLWVLFCKESPAHSPTLENFPDMFNWTMSYRLDSDIWSPYGVAIPLDNLILPEDTIIMPGNVTLSEWIASKTDLITGVISHCTTQSKREALVVSLQNAGLPLQIFGHCTNRVICSRNDKNCSREEFWNGLATKYKFYFAAENALCVDYITEKFWRTLKLGMVPVVYGGANYSAVAPPHSYIDVRDFNGPADVTKYLMYLSNIDTEYAKYFQWKRKYRVQVQDGWGGWCKLCNLAKQFSNIPYRDLGISARKVYKDLSRWWLKTGEDYTVDACIGSPITLQS